MRRRKYGGYHGESGVQNALKVVACLLVIGLMLVLAGLVIGQRYLVYTDDGVRLELPFFHREQTPADTSVPINVIQVPGTPKPTPEPPVEETEQTKEQALS